MVRNSRLSTFFYHRSFLYANQPARPSIYCCGYSDRGLKPCQPSTACLPSRASMGLEIDLIRIQMHAFDLTFVRQMHPPDNMLERTE